MRLTVLFWLFYEMSESETYKELGALTKCKERWEECIPYVASLLTSDSVKIQAKALWMLGEMGLAFPEAIKSICRCSQDYCTTVTRKSGWKPRKSSVSWASAGPILSLPTLTNCTISLKPTPIAWSGFTAKEPSGLQSAQMIIIVFDKSEEFSSMEAIMIWAKENYDLICLLVGVIGVLISIIGIVYEIKKKRKDKLNS